MNICNLVDRWVHCVFHRPLPELYTRWPMKLLTGLTLSFVVAVVQYFSLLLALLMGQYCFADWRLSSSFGNAAWERYRRSGRVVAWWWCLYKTMQVAKYKVAVAESAPQAHTHSVCVTRTTVGQHFRCHRASRGSLQPLVQFVITSCMQQSSTWINVNRTFIQHLIMSAILVCKALRYGTC